MEKKRKIFLKPIEKNKLKQNNSLNKTTWKKKNKQYKNIYFYIVSITLLNKNIFFNVTDIFGNTKIWTSAGRCGFRGKNKIVNMAIITITEKFIKDIWHFGVKNIVIRIKGFPHKRRPIIKTFKKFFKKRKYRFKIFSIENQLSFSFNGCKKKKRRRK